MRHIEPVVSCPVLTAREPGHSVLEPTIESGRGRHAFSYPAWRLPSPSGPLRARGPAAISATFHSGRQRCLHRQALPKPHSASPPNGPCPQSAYQPLGCSSVGGATAKSWPPWVEAQLDVNWPCNYNLGPIVWRHKSWPKHTSCWFLWPTNLPAHR